jgi:hypothetical protein
MQPLQLLCEGDSDGRIEFCEWVRNKLDGDANLAPGILFTDEAKFYIKGEMNRQNLRYLSYSSQSVKSAR